MKHNLHIGVVHNKHAGTSKRQAAAPKLIEALEVEFTEITYKATTSVQEEKTIAQDLCCKNVDIIIICGGDGSVHHTINGLMEYPNRVPPIAIFPIGSGNDFSRSFKIQANISKLIHAIKKMYDHSDIPNNLISNIDIGKVTWTKLGKSKYFANSIGMGMDAETVKYVHTLPKKTQSIYLKSIWHIFRHYDFPLMKIKLNGMLIKKRCTFVLACNGRYAGGKMIFAPDAKTDDGMINTIVVSSGLKPIIMLHLPLLYLGWHIYSPIVKTYKSKSLEFLNEELALQMDGESYHSAHCEITIAEKSLELLIP